MRRLLSAPRRGQAMVMTAALVSVFFGMLALSVDVGFGLAQRRASHNAADAAALAAAKFLAGQVSLDASGNVVFIEANDGLLWNAASPFFTANRIGGQLTPTFRTAPQYLDCSRMPASSHSASRPRDRSRSRYSTCLRRSRLSSRTSGAAAR